jgi:hypothetical protein
MEYRDKIGDVDVPMDLEPARDVELAGQDGNAGAIMGRVSRGLKAAGNSTEIIDDFRRQSMSGDYDHLLRVAMVFVGDLE